MLRDFLMPDWKKIIVYLVLVILFMGETLFLRSVYQKDYVVVFLLNVYNSIFSNMDYANFFLMSFVYYLFVLMILYLLSCFVVMIISKIKK
jgi:hypothetical protein